MREILFRGKRKDNGEWIEGDFLQDKDLEKCYIEYFDYYSSENGPQRDYCQDEVVADTVGQYTGLTDKTGKKIFEGDIVKSGYIFGKVVYATAQDGYEGMAGFMVDDVNDGLQNYDGFWHRVEVVGNIHDNPELLEGGVE